ncbi:MAG: phosphatase PAP2 family protein [Chloroflexi bacterium]|nr:phosphatase PAP2 family protein [Chloroflexota bacterium]MDA1219004.1 phosphatase PAP2 family protein [Chloroflexota bacterium]
MSLPKTVYISATDHWSPWGRMLVIALIIAVFILAAAFPNFPGDQWVLLEFQEFQTTWLTGTSLALSYLGSTATAASLSLAAIIALWLTHRRTDSLIALLGSFLIVGGISLKLLVDRPRPEYFLVASGPHLSSFPSGHTIFATIFFGIAIVLVGEWVQRPSVRRGLQTGLVLMILAMGASRVYLGFHWPSDVLGGYLYGGVAVVELVWVRNRLANRGILK